MPPQECCSLVRHRPFADCALTFPVDYFKHLLFPALVRRPKGPPQSLWLPARLSFELTPSELTSSEPTLASPHLARSKITLATGASPLLPTPTGHQDTSPRGTSPRPESHSRARCWQVFPPAVWRLVRKFIAQIHLDPRSLDPRSPASSLIEIPPCEFIAQVHPAASCPQVIRCPKPASETPSRRARKRAPDQDMRWDLGRSGDSPRRPLARLFALAAHAARDARRVLG